MRKIISIVCWIFVLCLTIENINFVYAQNEITENTQTDGVTNGLTVEELPNDLEIQDGENSRSSTILRWAPALWIPQTIQTIDTSDYGIIRIKDPNNTWKWITMLDRNLWATATWAWVDESRQSFWYYFQWWNNYGFPSDSNAEISTTTDQADASGYWPNTENGYYSSNIFVKWNSVWSGVSNDNLRWWSGDSRDGNSRWYPVTNPEDRRWPCPENYHIPSIWEWSKLLEFWAWERSGLFLFAQDGLYQFSDDEDSTYAFYQRFNIPIAGRRGNDGAIDKQNNLLLMQTSSPYGSTAAFRLYWKLDGIYATYINPHTYAFPIRCFYNSYRLPVKITYDINWWFWGDEEDEVSQKTITYTRDDYSEYLWDVSLWKLKPNNNCWENKDKNCMFGWWYTLTGDNLWTWNISEDITLYAKWLPYEEKDILLSGVAFIIMDRNLWADTSWIDENSYGYYFTWGENDIVCPEGYHIPSTWEWLWIKKLLGLDFNSDFIKNLFNLPFAGIIENDIIKETWEKGYYLAKNSDEIMYAKISDSDIEIINLNEREKVSVRCFKDYNQWTIKFHSNSWNNISDVETMNWREDWENLVTPTREHSIFLWWYNQDNVKIEKNINYKNEEEINLYAKWECEEWYQENKNKCERIPKPSEWSSGWGGRWSSSQNLISNDNKKSAIYQTWNSSADSNHSVTMWQPLLKEDYNNEKQIVTLSQGGISEGQTDLPKAFPQEFIDAYNFAYKNWITTKPSIYDAKMYSPVTRIQMAKMISNYAINILWRNPNVSKWVIRFDDVSSKLNKEYGNAVTLAYQLGIMWQNIGNNKFRPYDEVTRAEFATALSRLLYWTEDWTNMYYVTHIAKLHSEWIIKKFDPTSKEKRWYVMIMLMRSVESN